MQLEELNKSQIVLLTMLVSFVTSIATGIVTASLIEEAPTDVTRVIQRVVERTVENVNPSDSQQATVVTTERTVIVKESDLIAAAVAKNKSRVVRVLDATTGVPLALGIFVGGTGEVATDASALFAEGTYSIDNGSAEPHSAELTHAGGARNIALLKISTEDMKTQAAALSDKTVQLGQTVIAFVDSTARIAQGIVTGIEEGGYISTDIADELILPGAPLLNVDGEVVGMSTGASRELGQSSFLPARALLARRATLGNPTAAAGTTEGTMPDEEPTTTATTTEESADAAN